MSEKLQAVKGMNDILPEEMPRWHRLEAMFRVHAERCGFSEVRPPLVEPTALFVRSIGETTDIVEKEMYTFTDRGEKSLTLRPEGTASCVRAYLEHNVGAKEPITRWYYLGPMYRRERPAKGRYRQFYQAGLEVFGDPGPYLDAEIIDMIVGLLRELGVRDVEVLINSLGGNETRAAYREALVRYFTPKRTALCADCQRRLETNPLRLLDCKVPADAAIAKDAPSILNELTADDRAHFDGLRETLDALGTPYTVDAGLVRGLDYYTRTLFEVRGRGGDLGAQNALLGGGRYDGMVESLGGAPTPAFGLAMGLERLLLASEPVEAPRPTPIALAVLRPELRAKAVAIAQSLRRAGLGIETDLRGSSLKSQLRRADKLGVSIALILGDDEAARGTIQLKDLRGGEQVEVKQDALADELVRRLSASG